MLETCRGSEDGFGTEQFFANTCYDVRDSLACRFISAKKALPEYQYINLLWKSGDITREIVSGMTDWYIKKGMATITREITPEQRRLASAIDTNSRVSQVTD